MIFFFFKTNPKIVKFKIKHSECYTTKVAAEHLTSQSSSHLSSCWSTDIPLSPTFGKEQQKVHHAQRCNAIKCPSNPVQWHRAFHCICVKKQKVSGALHVHKQSLSELRKLMKSWWIITFISWPGRIKKPPNPSPCFSLRTSVSSFPLASCFPPSWCHTQQPPTGQCWWGKGWHRVSAVLTWISLSHHERALSKTIPRPSSTWKQARI